MVTGGHLGKINFAEMDIKIRRITPREAQALSDMATVTFYDTFTGTCTEADMQQFLETYFNLQQTQKELNNQDDFFYFAEADGVPVGYLRIMEDYRSFELWSNGKRLK